MKSLAAATLSSDELAFRIFTTVMGLHVVYALFSGRLFKLPVKRVGLEDRWWQIDQWFLDRTREPFGFWLIWTIYLVIVAAFIFASISDARAH